MDANRNPNAIEALAPTAPAERIEALDVVRGFALIGIFLMNVEYFNRGMGTMGQGMPTGLSGLDWLASWFIAYFVQGKFWTIFSTLFGMGFALMLARAEKAGRGFIAPYLRRVLALAVFGAAHYIFIWNGDILFSYAVAAGALMIVSYGRAKPILLSMLGLCAIGFVPGLNFAFAIAGGLAFVGLVTLYMRNEKRVSWRGYSMPLSSFVLLALGIVGVIAATVLWLMPNAPEAARAPVTALGIILLIFAFLSARFREPEEKRRLRVGASLYLFMATMTTIGGAVQLLRPVDPPVPAAAPAVAAPAVAAPAVAAPAKEAAKKPPKTEAEKAAERQAARARSLKEFEKANREEERIFSKGTYRESVEFRAREFPAKAVSDALFAVVLIGMFLIGAWFVRSGVMENTRAQLPLFRRLATYLLPVGIGLGLLGSLIARSHTLGDNHDGYGLAQGLLDLGNLGACLGYVGLVIVMLHSNSVFSKVRVLAPAGRMALTNYLTQSVISTFIFYGYALGNWGMPRAWQVVYVAVFFGLQVAFSHWWLARFRYGPMEWVWRAFTYRTMPAMRIGSDTRNIPPAALHG